MVLLRRTDLYPLLNRRVYEMKPTEDKNFCRVFELPEVYPEGFCFGGGRPVTMLMVDWFNPWPNNSELETWEEVKKALRPWIIEKSYVKKGRQYLLITGFGESMLFGKEND